LFVDNIIFAFCFCFSSPLLTYTFCDYPNNSSMDVFFQFSSLCNVKQKPEGLRVEGGGGGGVEAWRAALGLPLAPEPEGRAGKRGREGRRVNPH
jgi:hypothetical protein